MKVESIEKPQPPPPPPPLKEVVIRLSEDEANLLYTLLIYFTTTAPAAGGPPESGWELRGRRQLRAKVGDKLRDALSRVGANMVFGLND